MERENLNKLYSELVDDYKDALKSDINIKFRDFARNKNINIRKAENWLKRSGTSVTQLKRDVLKSQGKENELLNMIPINLYERTWALFKDYLSAGNDVSLKGFCILHNVNPHKMRKWVERQNYTVTGLKAKLGVLKLKPNMESDNTSHFSDCVQKKLAKTLREYKKELGYNPDTSLKCFCNQRRVDYKSMLRWMEHLGVSVRQLKQAVILEDRCPKRRQNVFVQFKPNGGSNGDKLTGVKIQLADGSNLLVDECTVISLCAFINQYNNDQKRRGKLDV